MDKKLNESIRETLLITQEECAEVTQAISKVLRFGTESRWPEDAPTNREKLEAEVGDLLAMIDILIQKAYLSDSFVNAARMQKKEKLKKWSKIFE
jgi:NTP pyrophosphatase (non-canonical NTP hydrolase)